MELISLLKSEFFKLRRSFALIIAVFAPLFVSLLMLLHAYLRTAPVVPVSQPWHQYISAEYITWLELMLPLVTALIASFYITVENKASGYKQLFSLPVSRFKILLAKVIIMWLLLLNSAIWLALSILISGYLLGILKPEYLFHSTVPDIMYLFLITLIPFFASLFVITLQFIIAFFTRKFILSLMIGIIGVIYTLMSIIVPPLGILSPWLLSIKSIDLLPIEEGLRIPASFGPPINTIFPILIIATLCILAVSKYIIDRIDIH